AKVQTGNSTGRTPIRGGPLLGAIVVSNTPTALVQILGRRPVDLARRPSRRRWRPYQLRILVPDGFSAKRVELSGGLAATVTTDGPLLMVDTTPVTGDDAGGRCFSEDGRPRARRGRRPPPRSDGWQIDDYGESRRTSAVFGVNGAPVQCGDASADG